MDTKTEIFISKANLIHNNTYEYSNIIYISKRDKTKLFVTCKEHGDFEISVKMHLDGYGCPTCRVKKKEKDFIQKANLVHNNVYDYSKLEYINAKTNMIIICKKVLYLFFKKTLR